MGVLLIIQAGYDPNELIRAMEIPDEASVPDRVPEFQRT